LEKGTWTGINIGPGVRDLASGLKFIWYNLIESLYEVDEVIILNVFIREVKFTNKSGVSFSKDSMAIARNNLTWSKSFLNMSFNIIFSPFVSVFLVEILSKLKAFLVSKSMKRTSKTIHTSGKWKIRVR
jgi:hypothetical protein